MADSGDDDLTPILAAGLSNGNIRLSNGQTRYFLVNNNRSNSSFVSSSSSISEGTTDDDDDDKEMNIVFLLHPSSRIENSDPYTPATVFESLTRKNVIDAATSAFHLDDDDSNNNNELVLVYLASRDIGNGWWCWGAGDDNNLCTSPVDGTDQEFFKETLAHVKKSLALPSTGIRTKVFLFGYSGGARMAWRLTCDPEISNLLDGVSMAAGLLPASLREDFEEEDDAVAENISCRADQLPPSIVVLHGDMDTTTNVEFAYESVQWVAQAAGCDLTDVDVIRDEILEEYSNCTKNERQLALKYYRRVGGVHITPDDDQMQRIFEDWQTAYKSPSNQPSFFPSRLPSNTPSATISSSSPVPSYTASDIPTLIPTSLPSDSPSISYSMTRACSNENFIQMNNFLENFQDKEFYMVDLYKFRNKAIYEDGRNTTGAQAVKEYTKFLVRDILPSAGAQLTFNLELKTLSEWDEIHVVKYPNAAMFEEQILQNPQVEEMRTHLTAGLNNRLAFATSLVNNIQTALLDDLNYNSKIMLRGYPKVEESLYRDSCTTTRCPKNSYCMVHNNQVENSFALNKADGTFFTCHCKSGYDASGWRCEPGDDSTFLSPALSHDDPVSILFHVLQFTKPDGRSSVEKFDKITSTGKYRYGLKPLGWLEVEAMCAGEQNFDQIRFESVPSFQSYGELINKDTWTLASRFREEGITPQSYSSFATPVLFTNLYHMFKQLRRPTWHR